jgi:hypothetical protein
VGHDESVRRVELATVPSGQGVGADGERGLIRGASGCRLGGIKNRIEPLDVQIVKSDLVPCFGKR